MRRRLPTLIEVLLVAVLVGAGLLEQLTLPPGGPGPTALAETLILLGAILPLLGWRLAPLAVQIAIGVSAAAAQIWMAHPGSAGNFALLYATFTATGASLRRRTAWVALAVAIAAITVETHPWEAPVTRWLYGYVIFLAVFAGGLAQRRRALLTARLDERIEATQRHRARLHELAVQDARNQLAHEVRGVVVAALAEMAGSARIAFDALRNGNGTAEAALGSVEQRGREVLTELRRLLRVLRRDGSEDATRPVPATHSDHNGTGSAIDPGELRLVRPTVAWLGAHALIVDAMLVVILSVVALVEFGPEHQLIAGVTPPSDAFSWKAQAWAVGWIALLLLRRWQPFATATLMAAMACLQNLFGYFTPITDIFASQLAVFSAGRRSRVRWLPWLAALLNAVGLFLPEPLTWSFAGSLVIFATTLGGAAYLGRVVAERDRLNAELARSLLALDEERRSEVELATRQDRLQVARDTHDLVAHAITVMVVQAGAARSVARSDQPAAQQAARIVAEAGDTASHELDQLLALLGHGVEAAAPPPRDLEELVGEARASGIDVQLQIEGTDRLRQCAGTLALSTYRIVQESLTNVRKHAPGAHVLIKVRYRQATLDIRIENSPGRPPRPTAVPGSGHGLLGIRERVAMLGGRVEAGPLQGGGFLVDAMLPRAAA
jgi:signal transduction histidine kinase